MMLDAPPIEQSAPAPIPSRNVMIWGDVNAKNSLRAAFETKGWRWMKGELGKQTPVLVLIPPATVGDVEITTLTNDLNSGKFGNLNGGYAMFGLPAARTESTI